MKNFIALLIFGGALTALYFYWQYEGIGVNLTDNRQSLTSYEQTVELKRAEFKALVNALEWQKDNDKKLAALTDIQAKEAKLRESYNQLANERFQIVSKMRQAVIGKTIPELILADGKKLTQAKITKLDDNTISITLPSGVLKITPSDLSADWKERLHY